MVVERVVGGCGVGFLGRGGMICIICGVVGGGGVVGVVIRCGCFIVIVIEKKYKKV